jgi:putative tryptophan/tyrosine transport system substrate-binding protein
MIKNNSMGSVNARRRWLAAGVGLPAVAWLGALQAQAKPPVVIGVLGVSRPAANAAGSHPFHEGMAALGWTLGTHYVMEERYADGRVERLPALAQELAARKPAVIVASPSAVARAAADAAPTTPIVLVNGDPMSTGLVTSLARPGGMITGLSNVSADANLKIIELLVEASPKLRRIGFLADSSFPTYTARVAEARRAAERLRVEAVIVDMAKPEDIEPAVARLVKDKAQALVLLASVWFFPHLARIMEPALAQRWPVAGNLSNIARGGGLFSFGPDVAAMARRAAYYVDRILKGAKPAELPIEQPTAFNLILNMKTAKLLGITIPQAMLLRATEVIE